MTVREVASTWDEFDCEKTEAFLDKEESLERKLEREIILKLTRIQLGCSLKPCLVQSELSCEFRNGNGTRNRSISNVLDARIALVKVKFKCMYIYNSQNCSTL